MKTYTYLLFDWDGCLAQTLEVWMNGYKLALSKYNIHPTEQEIAFHFGDWQLPKYFGIQDIEGCMAIVRRQVDKEVKTVALYEGARELLDTVRKTKKLALLSSSPREIITAALDFHGIQEYFDIILSAEDVEHHKPHPEIIEKALEALSGSKDQSIMIGDSRKDIEASNNAGVDSLLFYPNRHALFYSFDELKRYHPTYIISHLSEGLKFLV